MSNLFIVGNGFDLAHGLKTGYRHFRQFLAQMEKEECAETGETSIIDDPGVLKDGNIKQCFENIVIPTMANGLSETINILEQEDPSTGKTPMEQMDELEQFLNDANKIVQWIKHGSGQYYVREKQESKAIRRFITLLESETGRIDHNTNLNDDTSFFHAVESEFGHNAVRFLESNNGSSKIPFWLTLRLFIKMIDIVEGEDWKDLETSMGTYSFDMIFGLFSKLESDDVIYMECIKKYFVDLYYDINLLFNSWVAFASMGIGRLAAKGNDVPYLRMKKHNNNIELSIRNNNPGLKEKLGLVLFKAIFNRHPMAKKQLLKIFDAEVQNYFFTFNYTQTLERIYDIHEDRICHIHGVSRDGTENLGLDDFIFGHGRESFDVAVTDIERTAYNITKKPVGNCITKNQPFFEKLNDVDNIFSYGFSFGDVDMPYIEKICKSICDTSHVIWYFNDFRIEECRALYEEKIRKAGFKGTFGIFHID